MKKGRFDNVRGMPDLLPAEAALQRRAEETAAGILEGYGYREIRLPLVEPEGLFRHCLGAATDIVEKEMYRIDGTPEADVQEQDQQLCLRPEGTAGCVRAAIAADPQRSGLQRLWYRGAMFRRERPQKGRRRQFHQVGAEVFGLEGPAADAELVAILARLWQHLGVGQLLELRVHTLGDADDRSRYRERLAEYLQRHADQLGPADRRRLQRSPLRVLDSKDADTRRVLAEAPRIQDCLSAAADQHFRTFCQLLDSMKIRYRVDPLLVRGLDYYSRTVFEWAGTQDSGLGAQDAVAAGGRYDQLFERLGGDALPAAGFAVGIERLCLLMEQRAQAEPAANPLLDACLVADKPLQGHAGILAEKLRDDVPGLRLVLRCGAGSEEAQSKRARRKGDAALLLLLLEADASREPSIRLRELRGGRHSPENMTLPELTKRLRRQVHERAEQ